MIARQRRRRRKCAEMPIENRCGLWRNSLGFLRSLGASNVFVKAVMYEAPLLGIPVLGVMAEER